MEQHYIPNLSMNIMNNTIHDISYVCQDNKHRYYNNVNMEYPKHK